jgi:tagatose 6-phosphate kinase
MNAALDVTYTLDRVQPHAANRVRTVSARPGGKGINVARVLASLGREVLATGLVAGETGQRICAELAASGLPHRFMRVRGESRRALAVVEDELGDATGYWEPGPDIAEEEWKAFLGGYHVLLRGSAAAVLSGSLPPGLAADTYAELVRAARVVGVPVLLDAEGESLRRAVAAGPDVVKPNLEELRSTTGQDDALDGAQWLLHRGAKAVVVSAGPAGLMVVTPQERWAARLPSPLRGNPTGAGDACVAALTRGVVDHRAWPEILADAVALSASAVLRPMAGAVDLTAYRQLLGSVEVKAI